MRIWCPQGQVEKWVPLEAAPGSGLVKSGNYTMLTPQMQITLLNRDLTGTPNAQLSRVFQSHPSSFMESSLVLSSLLCK